MRGLTTLLIVLGFGSAALSFINIHYTLLAWLDPYQPAAGLIIGAVGALGLILIVMFSKDAPAQPTPQGPPQGFAPQPQGHPQPGQPQYGAPQGHPQPGQPQYGPPQGYPQPGAPMSSPQGFAQPGHPQPGAPVSPPQGFPQPHQGGPAGYPQQAPAGYPQQQGQYAPPQSFGPQG